MDKFYHELIGYIKKCYPEEYDPKKLTFFSNCKPRLNTQKSWCREASDVEDDNKFTDEIVSAFNEKYDYEPFIKKLFVGYFNVHLMFTLHDR